MTRYTKDHEWVRMEGDFAVIGISDYAAEQLGEVVYVELPAVGARFTQEEDMAVVESAKTASDVYAPIGGEIVAVNEAVSKKPETVNQGPESVGWFVKMKPANTGELDLLMDEAAYKAWIATL